MSAPTSSKAEFTLRRLSFLDGEKKSLDPSLIDELAQLREELHTLAAAQETSLAIRPPAPSELAGSRPANIVGLGVSLVALVLAVLALMVHGRG